MLTTIRKLLIGVGLVLALGAVGPALASAALPEFEGPFPNKFEAPQEFHDVLLATPGGRTIRCVVYKQLGEITSATTVSLSMRLKLCTQKRGTFHYGCTTIPAELTGKPVYINKKREIGIVFTPKAGGNFAEFTCGTGSATVTFKVRGSVIATITPANVKTKSYLLGFAAGSGVQTPSEYENEHGELVKATLEAEGSGAETFSFEPFGITSIEESETSTTPLPLPLVTTETTRLKAELASRGLPEVVVREGRFPVTFKGEMRNPSFFNAEIGQWTAEYATITGEITSPNDVANVVMTFHPRYSEGCWAGTETPTVTTALYGRIGYTEKSTKSVGLLLEPVSEPVASCTLRAIPMQWRHSIMGALSGAAGYDTSFNLQYLSGLNKFEGETALHQLELYVPSESRSHGPLILTASGSIGEFVNGLGKATLELRK